MHQYCVVKVNKVVDLHNRYYNEELTHKVCKLVIKSISTTKQSLCVVVVCRIDKECKV